VGRAVQDGNVVGGEEGGANVANETTDAVHGEDVEGVVDTEQELELRSVVGKRGTENTKDNSGPCGDVSCVARSVCDIC
jgi:hypothetical protein